MITEQVSARLAALRFPLIVGVVFIHEFGMRLALHQTYSTDNHQDNLAALFVENFISQGVARLAVPLFFLMSGFLFFQGYDGTLAVYRSKLRRRIHTLVLPYLSWNALVLLAIVMKRPQPGLKTYFATKYVPPILVPSVWNYVGGFLGITTKYPVSYQFWFIRDLIVLVALAPAFYFLSKDRRMGLFCLALLCGMWLSATWPFAWPADESLFFFFFGCYLAIQNVNICALDNRRALFGSCFGILLIAVAWTGTDGYLRRCMILAGLPFAWWFSEFAMRIIPIRKALLYLSGTSFFVFAAHEPSLSTFGKVVSVHFMPQSSTAELAIYFLLPICVTGMLVLLWIVLDRFTPGVLNVIAGRESKQKSIPLRRAA